MSETTKPADDVTIGIALLADPSTSLEKLKDSGWQVEMNMGGVVFFRHATQKVISIPFWALQLRSEAITQAENNTRREMRNAMGID